MSVSRDKRSSDKPGENAPTKLLLSKRFALDPEAKDLATRLKQARQRHLLTLEALSLVTKAVDPSGRGISRVSLSRYESGADPGARELRLLSQALRVPLAFLIYGGLGKDPMDDEMPALEDVLEKTIMRLLERQKFLPGPRLEGSPEYQALLERARKAAKE